MKLFELYPLPWKVGKWRDLEVIYDRTDKCVVFGPSRGDPSGQPILCHVLTDLANSHAEMLRVLEDLQPHVDEWHFPVTAADEIQAAIQKAKEVGNGC